MRPALRLPLLLVAFLVLVTPTSSKRISSHRALPPLQGAQGGCGSIRYRSWFLELISPIDPTHSHHRRGRGGPSAKPGGEGEDEKPHCLTVGDELEVKWAVKLGHPSGFEQPQNKPFSIGISIAEDEGDSSVQRIDVTDSGPAPKAAPGPGETKLYLQPKKACPTAGETTIKLDRKYLPPLPDSPEARTTLQLSLVSDEGEDVGVDPGIFIIATKC